MSKRSLAIGVLAAMVLLFALGLMVGIIVPRLASVLVRPKPFNTSVVVQQVQTLSELVTVKYVVEKVVVLEDVKWISGLGENRILMVAHGVVKAGIELGSIRPEDVRISGKKVSLALPKPRITDTYLDERQTRVVERTTGLLRMFDKDLEQNARQQAVEDIQRAARNGGILKDAETRARAQLSAQFKLLGFESVEFSTK
jgi:hypothetical protein